MNINNSPNPQTYSVLKTLIASVCIAVSSCATVNPVLISPGEKGPKEGLRFYEMRPFVLVQKPYPIWARTILVEAQVSDDGRNARVLSSVPSGFLSSFTTTAGGKDLSTQAITITSPGNKSPGDVSAQGALTSVPGGAQLPQTPGSSSTPTQPSTTTTPSAPSTAPATKSGSGSIAYQVNKDGTPMVPVNDLFSIIFLPDYEREYSIDLKSRFGFEKLQITTAPGGGLLAYNGEVDNSQLVTPLVNLYSKLVEAGGAVAEAAINPHAAAANALLGKASAQAAETTVAAVTPKLTPGSTVTLRLTLMRYAIPGPHRILKPGEKPSKIEKDTGVVSLDSTSLPVPYEVDYRYFETPIAEALLDSPSILTVIATNKVDQGGGAPGPSGGGCSAKKMMGTGAATVPGLQKLLDNDATTQPLGISVKTVTVAKQDSDNCVKELDVTATTGEGAAFNDPNGVAGKAFAAKSASTSLVFK